MPTKVQNQVKQENRKLKELMEQDNHMNELQIIISENENR
jgi:hypothetical protein